VEYPKEVPRTFGSAKEATTMIQIIRLKVRDFDAWKQVFDELRDVRAGYGFLGHTIYRDVGSPNDVTIVSEFTSREQAEEWGRSTVLADGQRRGGVVGQLERTWVEKVEEVSYPERKAA
jgi:heme-degrading monooxygenase HmoA